MAVSAAETCPATMAQHLCSVCMGRGRNFSRRRIGDCRTLKNSQLNRRTRTWRQALRDAVITHLTVAEGLGPLLSNVPSTP
jgi:hypothetical protein